MVSHLRSALSPALVRTAATGAALLTSLVGCDAGNTGPSEPVSTRIGAPHRVTSHSALPSDEYVLSDRDMAELRDRFNVLVQKCASRYGVPLRLVRDDPESVDQASKLWDGLFGTLPLEHAREYGYHAAPGGTWRQSFTIFVREDEQPQLQVLLNIKDGTTGERRDSAGRQLPDGGCRGSVVRLLGGDPYESTPSQLGDIRLAAMRHEATVEAMDEWKLCMQQRGHAFSRIDEPIDQALGQPLDDMERQVAVDDVECTRSSQWRDISFAVQTSLERQFIEDNRGMFEELRATQERMLERARHESEKTRARDWTKY